jgi:asparagine synthase (glutamine-hydrolysing)
MAERLGLRDRMVSAFAYPPFEPLGVRGCGVPHDPVAAYYREAFDALRDAVASGGTQVICTGLGGDELCARHPQERLADPEPVELPPWLGPAARAALAEVDANLAPVPASSMTALMAQASHNPAYLAAGIWPLAPLADPRLVRFGEQLPLVWRAGKRLLRERLRRAGLTEEVVNPPVPEAFSGLMQAGLRRYGLPLLKNMLTSSRLVDLGYLDHAALVGAYEAAMTSAHVPSTLCDAISLEVGLASLDTGGCAS